MGIVKEGQLKGDDLIGAQTFEKPSEYLLLLRDLERKFEYRFLEMCRDHMADFFARNWK